MGDGSGGGEGEGDGNELGDVDERESKRNGDNKVRMKREVEVMRSEMGRTMAAVSMKCMREWGRISGLSGPFDFRMVPRLGTSRYFPLFGLAWGGLTDGRLAKCIETTT